jgi:hypothetical protein
VNATTTAAEWLQMVSLAAGLYAAVSAPYFLLVDAEVWAWPRPLVGAVDGARPIVRQAADRLLVEICRARHTPRELAVAAAALLMLLTASEATS